MKNVNAVKFALPGLLFVLGLVYTGPLCAPLTAQVSRSGLSRSMEQAIRLYHEGQDSEAMDRFMDILVKGTPAEKALANEYISKITLRMNTGVNTVKDSSAEPETLNEVSGPKAAPAAHTKAAARAEEAADEETADQDKLDDDQAQKVRVSDKISAKIAQMRRDLLLELGRGDAVKIYMADAMPRALTLDPKFFFASDSSFRPGTEKTLAALSGLLFTLGKANCLILPEGSAEGDVKINSIRRAIAMSSYLEQRGISKARMEVNLTGADARFPKELTNIKGMIIIFNYDKAPRLKDLEDLQTKGPKVSLGVYPTAISVQNNEGAIVEFSAFESPIGQPSWKFQIYEVQADGSRLLLQDISGSGPQYNQSFWNGRKKFFGAPYPSGRYLFTVTATDVEGRDTSLSRFLLVRPSPAEEKAALSRPAPQRTAQKETVTASGIKTRTVGAKGAAGAPSGKLLNKAAALKKARAKAAVARKAALKNRAAKKKAAEAAADGEGESAPEKPAKPAKADAAAGEFSSQVSYKIYFKENTSSITANSEKKLAQVAETLGYYPMANISLIGYAYSGEANADAMAENRVNYVAARLADKYKIDRARMDVQSKVAETPKSIVEIKMSGKE